MSAIYNNIGEIFRLQGDLEQSLENYENGLSLGEEMGHKNYIAANLDNIGFTYYEKVELDKGLKYLKKSLKLFKEISNNFEIARTLFKIIQIYLNQNDLESARKSLEEMKNLSEKEENKRNKYRYLILKALILKKSERTRNIIKAHLIVNEIVDEKAVENE